MIKTDFKLKNLNPDIRLGCLAVRVVSFTHVYPDKTWRVTRHSHTDIEIHIIPDGKGVIEIEDTQFTVNSGEFYITGPFVKHTQTSDIDHPMTEYCLECELSTVKDSPLSVSAFQEALLVQKALSAPHKKAFKDNEVIALSEKILQEDEKRETGYILKLQSLILELILRLFRVVSDVDMQYPGKPHKSADALRIKRLVGYIEANYKSDISLSDASKALFLSGRQINRLMEKHVRQTFHSYLTDYRISIAKSLLVKSELSIEEIACEAGFSSHFYMYQVFKNAGLEPPAKIRSHSCHPA